MRGTDSQQAAMFSYLSPEQRVPLDHPLRPIRAMAETVLQELSPQFAQLYSHTGRPSIPRRSSSGPCSCRCSTPCEASGSSWSSSTTTSSSAGSWA